MFGEDRPVSPHAASKIHERARRDNLIVGGHLSVLTTGENPFPPPQT